MGDLGVDAGLTSALVLDADVTVAAALESLTGLPATAYVVIIDHAHRPVRYVVIQAGSLRKALTGAAEGDAASSIRIGIRLDEKIAADVVDVALPDASVRGGSVVLRGRTVLGVAVQTGGSRSAPTIQPPVPPPVSPPVPAPSSVPRPSPPVGDRYVGAGLPQMFDESPTWGADDDAPALDLLADPPQSGADPPQSGPDGPGADASGSTGGEAAGRDGPVARTPRFRAFPSVTGPESVTSDADFRVEVGFTRRAQSAGATPVVTPPAPEVLDFEVQVDGFGFRFPEGVRQPLSVDRDDPEGETVEFTVVAEAVESVVDRTIEVTFSLGGAVVGLAWVDITVLPADDGPAAPLQPDASPATQPRGGSAAIGTAERPADLTVKIRTHQGLPEVRWQFQSPHAVTIPDQQVTTALPSASAQAFAEQLMAQLPALKGTSMIDNALRGLGGRVSRAMPIEFWRVLAEVWAAVEDRGGEAPSLMLITDEPYVPWELAWMEAEREVPARFLGAPDPTALRAGNQQLGAIWSIGRWIVPVPQPIGPDRPSSPPAVQMDASTMAVVVGNYTAAGIPALPAAVAEAQDLAVAYGALSVDVDEASVMRLLDNQLTRDDKPFIPSIVHMAVHGRVGLEAQQYTGIVLRDKRVVDPLVIEGSSLGASARPFVFLNACQVGTASTVLNSYGGMASAFLLSGARGFVAPLWNVDDDVARGLSLGFYEDVLEEGVTVGEAVRRIRAAFLADPEATPTATPMAYVFYGHPHLTLSWS